MFKLLVLSCLLVSGLADPPGLPSWLREAGRAWRHLRGCANRAEGWRACARVNNSDSLAPHAHDCSAFFYCSSAGAPPLCRKCPAGLSFNPQLQVCDWPENVDCKPRRPRPFPSHNSTTPLPATVTDASTKPDVTTTNALSTDATPPDVTTTNAPSTDTTPPDVTTTNAPSTDTTPPDVATTNAPLIETTTFDDTTTEAASTTEATSPAVSYYTSTVPVQ